VDSQAETTIAHLPAVRLAKLPVTLPPVEEQRRIGFGITLGLRLSGSELLGIPSWPAQQKVAEKALGIEAAREKLAEQLSAIETLPAAFLRQAFRGEL
jgi:restriction endonuclease S subunit